MSDGIRDAFQWAVLPKEKVQIEGDGTNTYSVHPNDPRWTSTSLSWDDFDEETQELPFLDQFGQKLPYRFLGKKCECGSHKTTNPNLHLTWCPLFTDPMEGR